MPKGKGASPLVTYFYEIMKRMTEDVLVLSQLDVNPMKITQHRTLQQLLHQQLLLSLLQSIQMVEASSYDRKLF